MRGKLRDKRTATKPNAVKREVMERPRSNKRDMRTMDWLNQEVDDGDEIDEEEMPVQTPKKK